MSTPSIAKPPISSTFTPASTFVFTSMPYELKASKSNLGYEYSGRVGYIGLAGTDALEVDHSTSFYAGKRIGAAVKAATNLAAEGVASGSYFGKAKTHTLALTQAKNGAFYLAPAYNAVDMHDVPFRDLDLRSKLNDGTPIGVDFRNGRVLALIGADNQWVDNRNKR